MHAYNKNLTEYRTTEILTADQQKLIIMLYEGSIRFIRNAADAMQPKSYDKVNENLLKAQDIITELMVALNMEEGGDIALNLFNIYVFWKKSLLDANIKKDKRMLEDVIRMIESLKGAWENIPKQNNTQSINDIKPTLSIQG